MTCTRLMSYRTGVRGPGWSRRDADQRSWEDTHTTSGHKGWSPEEQGGAGGKAGIACLRECCAQGGPTHLALWTTPNSMVLPRQGQGPPKVRQTSGGVRRGESSTGLVWESLGSGLGYATYYMMLGKLFTSFVPQFPHL